MLSFALFVTGHECGHGTFSNYEWINDIFGHLCHSPLMVPYWPWKKSHNRHHQFTSHIDKDMGHAWITEDNHFSMNFFVRHMQKPILITGFILWLPIYLILGYADGSHYWPGSKLYINNKERIQCAISSLSCIFCAFHFIFAITQLQLG
uniref:Fatty acid desaturase domain-containing protein n=2 Tax=Panagrolaimus sp. JU765 TaxID=591449 RepID=A0AC34Q796_9BILA